MKIEMTKKNVIKLFKNVVRVPSDFDVTQFALPDFYTAGVYGWNADVYRISHSTVLVQGDRPFGNMTMPRDVADDFARVWAVIIRLVRTDERVAPFGEDFAWRFTSSLIDSWVLSRGKDDFAELYRGAFPLFLGNSDVANAVGEALTLQGFDVPLFVPELVK